MLQIVLKNYGYYELKIDGQFGPASKSALKNFQTENGLISDGIIGKNTCNSLFDKKNVIKNNGTKKFLLKYGFNPKFFRKYYLNGGADSIYDGPLNEPQDSLIKSIDLLINKIKFFYYKMST